MAYCKKLFFIFLFALLFILLMKNYCFANSYFTFQNPYISTTGGFTFKTLDSPNDIPYNDISVIIIQLTEGDFYAILFDGNSVFISPRGAGWPCYYGGRANLTNNIVKVYHYENNGWVLDTSKSETMSNNVDTKTGTPDYPLRRVFNTTDICFPGKAAYNQLTNGVIGSSYEVFDYYSGNSFYNKAFDVENAFNIAPQPSLDIRFPTASTDLIGIAQGNLRTIEIELLNYDVEQMPDFLYLNFYKKQGNNYNIYSIPIYIYEQFPTYVTQAPLNDDLFLFVDKSKLYSMGINFSSGNEFYLFLSDDVSPKGYSSWNDNGTGLLLGTTFETTEATIYAESGLITIPTLTTEQEQDNQNQSDTQKQIDAINKQTEQQKETKDFLKDDNIDDSNIALPSIETNDITEDGIDNIFTAIYNGLTSGEARDIVLPFPFTNKSIIIPANYTEQFLTTSVFSPIYLIIQAFYWYIIARFIVKDIASKFEKIKSGNIENLENNNIKTEML